MNITRSPVRPLVAFAALCLCVSAPACGAQDIPQAPSSPVFSVISVKRNGNDQARSTLALKPDGISSKANTAKWFLVVAFGVKQDARILGAPSWAVDEYYDVEAKVDDADAAAFANLPRGQKYLMLQQVLIDRFHLKYHLESRDFQNFNLVLAKGGPKLAPSVDPSKVLSVHSIGFHSLKAESASVSDLCTMILSTEAQHLVFDKTGLTGKYDFTLHWSREGELVNSAPSDAPGIFTAVQEQLGLKMVPVITPTKVIVVDHIERPSEN